MKFKFVESNSRSFTNKDEIYTLDQTVMDKKKRVYFVHKIILWNRKLFKKRRGSAQNQIFV